MSLAFERALRPPARSACLSIVICAFASVGAALGVAYAWQRWSWPAAAALASACAAVLFSDVLATGRSVRQTGGASGATPVLRVDALGRACVRWHGRDHDCAVRHWLLADHWVALSLELDDPSARRGRRRLDLVSGGQDGDDSWRRLRVWLTWLQRGSPPEGTFDPGATSRKPLEFPTPLASHRSP